MSFMAILQEHLLRYPAMQIQDVYKLIHQAAMGSEHAISSADGARQWMARELSEMGNGPDEPVVDPVSADGQIVRVHLRPYGLQGGDTEALLNAFILTANEFRGDLQILEEYWRSAVNMQHFLPAEMKSFIESMQTQNYPAVHHSPEFENLYRPAYRVVRRKFIS